MQNTTSCATNRILPLPRHLTEIDSRHVVVAKRICEDTKGSLLNVFLFATNALSPYHSFTIFLYTLGPRKHHWRDKIGTKQIYATGPDGHDKFLKSTSQHHLDVQLQHETIELWEDTRRKHELMRVRYRETCCCSMLLRMIKCLRCKIMT